MLFNSYYNSFLIINLLLDILLVVHVHVLENVFCL